ncbi:2-hydroxychromene-2-carboxylate isomerase [Aquibaculum sediminis]|uniref:2-hydroxychromene-2-carboxylate isomerase n=1 Tax=Aquibaculum sediminis TaxID=3231907 RepID=UPI00345723B9
MASETLDFYFDFSSPYGYLAAMQIEKLAAKHDRKVAWKPFLLGAVYQKIGGEPLVNVPMKGEYSRRDMERCAREIGVPLTFPQAFPFASVAACRAVYWQQGDDPTAAGDLVTALYRKAFAEGGDISSAEGVLAVAEGQGIDRAALSQALQEPAIKQRFKQEVEAALERGVFGSPFIFVDDEPFWGSDRLEMVDRWLSRGGW